MTVRANALGSRYELVSQLGAGAMGTVWRARDLSTDEAVAAKILHDHFASDVGIVTRFLQERTFLLQLDHPNIVRVRDLVVEGSQLGIVMDLVEGSDVRGLLRTTPTLPPARAAGIVADVLDGLAHAHALSVLHRDVKPDNVLLDGDTARLSDFSIARLAQETTVRMTGVLGTADYMAPEVFDEQVSAASDVYGAGVLLYELLAGRTPFGGPQANAWAIAKRHEAMAPPEVPGLPDGLAALLRAMLDKTPGTRPAAAAAGAELRRLLPELAGVAALPQQQAPESWVEVAAPRSGISLRSAAPAFGDTDGTYVGGATTHARAPLPVAGPAPSAPAPEELDTSLTQLGSAARSRPVLDVPEIAPAAPVSRRRPGWVKVAAAAGAVALVGGVVAVASSLSGGRAGSRSPEAAAPTAAISAQAAPEVRETGLTVQRDATYDPAKHVVDVKVAYTSAQALRGPFLESIPALDDGSACPQVGWRSAQRGTVSTVPSVKTAVCAWSVVPGTLSSAPTTVEYQAALALPGKDKAAALQSWLERARGLEDGALASLGVVTDYAAQRLTALRVDVVASPVAGSQVQVQVTPQWVSDGTSPEDSTDVIWSSQGGFDDDLVAQLGGARSFSLVSHDCPDAIRFVRGGVPYAYTAQDRCTLDAQLGTVSGTSGSFSITNGS